MQIKLARPPPRKLAKDSPDAVLFASKKFTLRNLFRSPKSIADDLRLAVHFASLATKYKLNKTALTTAKIESETPWTTPKFARANAEN
jgi:hypothetical protein